MAVLPAVDYISDNVRTQGEVKTALEDMRDKIGQATLQEDLQISTGTVTPTGRARILRIESETAAIDDLDNIDPGVATFEIGDIIYVIRLNIVGFNITLRHNQAGNGAIIAAAAANIVLTTDFQRVMLQLQSDDNWYERVEA